MIIFQRPFSLWNSTIWAILLGSVGLLSDVGAEDLEWTYDFSTGSVSEDWKYNTNNPAATFSDFLPGSASFGYSGSPTFQSTAIHEDSHRLSVGDSLRLRLAWSPFSAVDSLNGNNEVFQLGVVNLDGQIWESTSDRFATGDSIWLGGHEIESTAVTMLDEWGTQKLALWLHNDELSTIGFGLGLGTIDIETFMQGADGSMSATFLDIDLKLELTADGSFDYDVEIFSYEWTQLGSVVSWFNEGTLLEDSGNFGHRLDSTDSLNPAIGFLVSDSTQLGVSDSVYTQAPLAVPEPVSGMFVVFGLGCLSLRRNRS